MNHIKLKKKKIKKNENNNNENNHSLQPPCDFFSFDVPTAEETLALFLRCTCIVWWVHQQDMHTGRGDAASIKNVIKKESLFWLFYDGKPTHNKTNNPNTPFWARPTDKVPHRFAIGVWKEKKTKDIIPFDPPMWCLLTALLCCAFLLGVSPPWIN